MDCNCKSDNGHGGHHGSSGCCCGKQGGFKRHFSTKAEQLQELENYLESLQNEIQAVTEQIEDIKK
jgi:hypothetical protein